MIPYATDTLSAIHLESKLFVFCLTQYYSTIKLRSKYDRHLTLILILTGNGMGLPAVVV